MKGYNTTDTPKKAEPYYRLYARLFEDSRYTSMRLEAIVLYAILLSRESLSVKTTGKTIKSVYLSIVRWMKCVIFCDAGTIRL